MLRTRFTLAALEFRINWLIALCVVFCLLVLVRLGLWQFARAQEKIEQQQAYQAMHMAQATPIQHLPIAGPAYDRLQLHNRRVALEGSYHNEHSILLVFQSYENQMGYEVVTPFQVAATGELVLVSRGWTPAVRYELIKEHLPKISGEQSLSGQIYVPSAREAAKENPRVNLRWPLELRHLNMAQIETLFDQPLFPYVVRLDEAQAGVLLRHWPTVIVDTSRNFSYALQWFAMAIALGIVSLLLCSNLLQVMRKKPAGEPDH